VAAILVVAREQGLAASDPVGHREAVRRPQLREDGAEPLEIFSVLSLARRELQRGELNEGWHAWKLAPARRGINAAGRSSSSVMSAPRGGAA
jgi:hypothetical protein